MGARYFLLALLVVLPAPAIAGDEALTEQLVCDYLATRIQTNHLQLHFQKNLDKYDDAPVAFFKARDSYLEDIGWSVEDFENTQQRIHHALYGMEKLEGLKEDERELAEEIAELKEKGRFDDPMSRRVIEMEQVMIDKGYEQLDESRPDWPAVRPHIDTFEHLIDWVAANVPNPPLGCDGEKIEKPPLPTPPSG